MACSPTRDEDVAATDPGQQLEAEPCACPLEDPDPNQECDVAAMQDRFASCPGPQQEPCETIELDCSDAPTNVGALDCVLDQLADGNVIRYSINRASCPDEGAYAVVVSSSEGAAFGLECYRAQSVLVPFDAAFTGPAHFAECRTRTDAAARYTCLEAGLGFAEGSDARCE